MGQLKTRPEPGDVGGFLATVDDPLRRADAKTVCALMAELTGDEPVMWGTSMVGFGRCPYRYASGRSGEWFVVGFSPRKQNLVLYLMDGYEQRTEVLARLGRHTLGQTCLYLKRLEDVDTDVLRELVAASVATTTGRAPRTAPS